MIDKQTKTAFIELAKSAGITLLSANEHDPLKTSTYGVGMMIRRAICAGCTNIMIFAGGSSTNDAGTGALAALGVKFYANRRWIEFPTGQDLIHIDQIDLSELITTGGNLNISVASDVNNPFYGHNGATSVYAPQKGAKPDDVIVLEQGMKHFSEWIEANLNINLQNQLGSGAAGGFSGGLHAFLGAKLESGSEFLFDLLEFDQKLQSADLVITGEGRIDSQSFNNKLVKRVIDKAALFHKPVYGICGSVFLSNEDINLLNFEHIEPMAQKQEEIKNCIANPNFYFDHAARRLMDEIRKRTNC